MPSTFPPLRSLPALFSCTKGFRQIGHNDDCPAAPDIDKISFDRDYKYKYGNADTKSDDPSPAAMVSTLKP